MDPYVRDFNGQTTETYVLDTALELSEILAVNKENVNFTTLHQNIRSINRNIDEFKTFLYQINTNIDCIVLTETWKIDNIDIFKLQGYEIIYNAGNFNKSDGVVVYIKNNIKYSYSLVEINNINIIELSLKLENKKIKIYAIYRSPASCPFAFNNDLKTLLENSQNNYDYTLLIGDLNIDILTDRDYANDYLNIMSENSFLSAINSATRTNDQVGTCIDHAFLKSKSELDFVVPIIVKTDVTDHFTIALQIVLPEKYNNRTKSQIKYKKILDIDKLKKILSKINWENLYMKETSELATQYFVNILNHEIENCTSKIKINSKNKKRKDWITQGLVKSINKKNELKKELTKNPDNSELEQKYKSYRNKLNNLIKITKSSFYKKQIDQNQNNSKNLWNVINQATNNNFSQNKEISSIRGKNGNITDNNTEISNEFNTYFTQIGKTLASKITKGNSNKTVSRHTYHKTMFIFPTDVNEVLREIVSLKNKKSSGFDGFSAEMLKTVQNEIAHPLTFIINKIFETGECPSHFKISVVKPIFKKGDETDIGNYRPISLISNLSKIFEKILKSRITDYLNKNSILSKYQFGFKEGQSTQDAINMLTHNIYKSLDNRTKSLCIFVDIQKAFDSVSHSLLLEKLTKIGIRGTCHKLMKTYLSGRKQCVEVNNTTSSYEDITCGVPQGTVLGPVLFNIYINDLFDIETKGTIIAFADDTAIYYKDKSWADLKQKVEKDMKQILNWYSENLLTINKDKTVYLNFSSYCNTLPDFQHLKVKVNDQECIIKSTEKVTYLGVVIDRHLRWDRHIETLKRKLRYVLCKIKQIKEFLDWKQLKIVYHALVESHLSYGIIAWGAADKTYIKDIGILQRRILKTMTNRMSSHSSDALYKELNILDIRQLFYLKVAIKAHSERIYLMPIDHDHSTRYKEKSVVVPLKATTKGQHSYDYLAPKIYNSIPESIKKVPSQKRFKYLLKRNLIQENRDRVHEIIN